MTNSSSEVFWKLLQMFGLQRAIGAILHWLSDDDDDDDDATADPVLKQTAADCSQEMSEC